MDSVAQWLETVLGISPPLQEKLLGSLLVILGLWLIRRVALGYIRRRTHEVRLLYRWRKTSLYVTVGFGAIVIGRMWFAGLRDITTFLGLVSAGLAIALRDLIVNLAGFAFILWRRPFEVGDRIQIGNVAGDVIDQRIFQFSLLEIGNWVDADQSTGRLMNVPNGRVLSEPLANYTKGFRYIWNEIPVLVTFESDWRKAKKILFEIATRHAASMSAEAERQVREAAQKFMIYYKKLTPMVYTNVLDSGVQLTIRYLCNPRFRRGTAQAIWEDVLDAFQVEPDIDFAYPTQRFYDHVKEGKPALRPE